MSQTAFINVISKYRELVIAKYDLSSEQLAHEWELCKRFSSFVQQNPSCFDSNHDFPEELQGPMRGHLTGSALVLSPDRSKVVLTLHKKLGKWLQLGGHADGHPRLEDVAKREAHEESGLKELSHASFEDSGGKLILPFDLDIHLIPGTAKKPRHYHYDVRFILFAKDEQLTITDESEDLRWFKLDEVKSVSQEESLHKQLRKVSQLLSSL